MSFFVTSARARRDEKSNENTVPVENPGDNCNVIRHYININYITTIIHKYI